MFLKFNKRGSLSEQRTESLSCSLRGLTLLIHSFSNEGFIHSEAIARENLREFISTAQRALVLKTLFHHPIILMIFSLLLFHSTFNRELFS